MPVKRRNSKANQTWNYFIPRHRIINFVSLVLLISIFSRFRRFCLPQHFGIDLRVRRICSEWAAGIVLQVEPRWLSEIHSIVCGTTRVLSKPYFCFIIFNLLEKILGWSTHTPPPFAHRWRAVVLSRKIIKRFIECVMFRINRVYKAIQLHACLGYNAARCRMYGLEVWKINKRRIAKHTHRVSFGEWAMIKSTHLAQISPSTFFILFCFFLPSLAPVSRENINL